MEQEPNGYAFESTQNQRLPVQIEQNGKNHQLKRKQTCKQKNHSETFFAKKGRGLFQSSVRNLRFQIDNEKGLNPSYIIALKSCYLDRDRGSILFHAPF